LQISTMWDAEQYLKFTDERARPFMELLARVQCERPAFIADLGCGPGNLTKVLADRWPNAHIVGVDHSTEMLTQAAAHAIPGRMQFIQADVAAWTPREPIDLIVSNAAFQWIGNHDSLLPRLAKFLSPDGTLAVQIPYHFENPAHLEIEAVKADPRWRDVIGGVGLNQQSVRQLAWYVERLHDLGFAVDAWQTTYLHVLSGANPVLEWFKGSALRPFLDALDDKARGTFLTDYTARIAAAYPTRYDGKVLLRFPRLFIVASR